MDWGDWEISKTGEQINKKRSPKHFLYMRRLFTFYKSFETKEHPNAACIVANFLHSVTNKKSIATSALKDSFFCKLLCAKVVVLPFFYFQCP